MGWAYVKLRSDLMDRILSDREASRKLFDRIYNRLETIPTLNEGYIEEKNYKDSKKN